MIPAAVGIGVVGKAEVEGLRCVPSISAAPDGADPPQARAATTTHAQTTKIAGLIRVAMLLTYYLTQKSSAVSLI